MGKHVLGKNTRVTVNGTDLSDHVSSVALDDSADEVDVTGFSETYREYTQGIKDMSVTVTFFQDYASSSVDEVVGALYRNDTAGTVKVNPDNTGTVVYTAVSKPYGYSPVNGAVGDANTIDVTFRNAGTAGLTRGTA